MLANTNAAAPVSFNTRYSIGDFYDGYRRGYTVGTTVRANEHFNVSGNVQFNDIDLPQGAFTTTLITGRVNYFLNTKVFLNALLQYNTDARAVELERPLQRHPPAAERHLPRLQRAPRLADQRPHRPRADREDDLPDRVLARLRVTRQPDRHRAAKPAEAPHGQLR